MDHRRSAVTAASCRYGIYVRGAVLQTRYVGTFELRNDNRPRFEAGARYRRTWGAYGVCRWIVLLAAVRRSDSSSQHGYIVPTISRTGTMTVPRGCVP